MSLRLLPLISVPLLLAATTVGAPASPSQNPIVAGVPRIAVRDLGPAPSMRVRLGIALPLNHENEMEPLAQVLTGIGAGRQVLTKQQFTNYFSPSATAYGKTVDALRRLGFTVVKTYGNRTAIDVEAPASVVDRAFRTEIHAVMQPSVAGDAGRAGIAGGIRYANAQPAVLPSELRSLVKRVVGFDNVIRMRPFYVRGPAEQTGVVLGPPLKGPHGGFGPFAFAQGYDFPIQHQVRGGQTGQTYDGTGQATANVIDSDFHDSDLATFLSYFNITRTGPATTRIAIDGGPNPQYNGDETETDLDVETIVGLAPGTALRVYLMHDLSDQDIFDAYQQILDDDDVDAANSSFGGCESGANGDPTFATQTEEDALMGVLLGITFDASSGDWGSGCPTNNGIQPDTVSAPASGPHFVAVGGTTLSVNNDGTYNGETCWDDSGGGVSGLFNQPSWQVGIPQMIGATRNVPDIAFDANPFSGAAIVQNNVWGVVGGTSLSSPIMTALVTEFDQFNGARYGDVHHLIYGRFRLHGYDPFDNVPVFHDVTTGNNGQYQCTTGYDQVSGIGSIDGWGGATAYRPD